jgi:hypothetical protein
MCESGFLETCLHVLPILTRTKQSGVESWLLPWWRDGCSAWNNLLYVLLVVYHGCRISCCDRHMLGRMIKTRKKREASMRPLQRAQTCSKQRKNTTLCNNLSQLPSSKGSCHTSRSRTQVQVGCIRLYSRCLDVFPLSRRNLIVLARAFFISLQLQLHTIIN